MQLCLQIDRFSKGSFWMHATFLSQILLEVFSETLLLISLAQKV